MAASAASPQKRPRSRKSIAHLPPQDSRHRNPGQENFDPAANLTENFAAPTTKADSAKKKSRSKSLGSGGLDALKESSGNRRKFASAGPIPKSILKPTIPLSPLKEIPNRKPAGKGVVSEDAIGPQDKGSEGHNDDQQQGTAMQDGTEMDPTAQSVQESSSSLNNSREGLGRSDNHPDAEAYERKKRKEAIQKQREERRKSMANRRVSFAPEATLHTFNVEDLMENTTSSGSAESTRASSFSQSQGSDSAQRPSTPAAQRDDQEKPASPEHQRDAHQKKRRRRSSTIPPMNFNDPDALSSSPSGSSSPIANQDSSASAESDDGETSGLVTAENTLQNAGTRADNAEADGDLDNSLSEASERAGTRQLELDDNGDVSMDIAGDEVTGAFKSWVKGSTGAGSPHPKASKAIERQETEDPSSPVNQGRNSVSNQSSPLGSAEDTGEMSMDMTRPIGRIVQSVPQNSSARKGGRKSVGRRQSMVGRRRSSAVTEVAGDGTMDFTTAVGGIQGRQSTAVSSQADENEDLSMEFTAVLGGLQGQKPQQLSTSGRGEAQGDDLLAQHQVHDEIHDGAEMEMTAPLGRIVHPKAPETVDKAQEEDTGAMDFTAAIGKVTSQRNEEQNSRDTVTASSPMRRNAATTGRPTLSTSATGSPSVSVGKSRGRPRKSDSLMATPTAEKHPQTPSKQITPQAARPGTPSKTPPSANISMRKSSPKKLFRSEIKNAASPASTTPRLYNASANDWNRPNVLLAPNPARHASGIGIDKEGLGSPRMADILNRRTSIGDQADVFTPKSAAARGVRFDDPQAMEVEVSRESEEDNRRESGQYIMEQEDGGEEKDATATLREMMQSMTPRKNKAKGRKSLHAGSAKGLLGKRPAELDDSEEERSPRTFGKDSSPVKRIRLHGPSPTTRNAAANSRHGLLEISGNERPKTPTSLSTPNPKNMTTPKSQGRFKDAERLSSAHEPIPTLGQTAPGDAEKGSFEEGEEKISLQDFLNLTNIRFMDLTTTKRRATTAPISQEDGDAKSVEERDAKDPKMLFEDAAAAGVCTIPMLELHQHSCRELKKYIAEGRAIVREIEAETLEENPPLFREYMTSRPGDRSIMDNQFKNMKTNARLLSKGTWYEWRMKLLEGLKESLAEISESVERDDATISRQEQMLQPILGPVLEEHSRLEHECRELQARAEELAACDPEDLRHARERLVSVGKEAEDKKCLIEEHRSSLQRMDSAIEAAYEAKSQCHAAARDAQKVREECRGWSAAEVEKLGGRVDALESSSGWAILSASGSTLTMAYQNQLQLLFDTAAFLPSSSFSKTTHGYSSISLAYMGDDASRNRRALPLTTTKRFFLQLLRASLIQLPPQQTHARDVLRLVSEGWSVCMAVVQEVEKLRFCCGMTGEKILGDEKLDVESDLLLEGVKTKVAVAFEVQVGVLAGFEVRGRVRPSTRVIYGEGYDEGKMEAFLRKRVEADLASIVDGGGSWAEATGELKSGLIRRGRKG